MDFIREVLEGNDVIYIISTVGSIGSAIVMLLCLVSLIKKGIRSEKTENGEVKRNAIGLAIAVAITVACVAISYNSYDGNKDKPVNSDSDKNVTSSTSTTVDEESVKESISIQESIQESISIKESIKESLSIQESISIKESEEESKEQEKISLSVAASQAEEQKEKEEKENAANNAKATLLDKQKLNTELLNMGHVLDTFTDNLSASNEVDKYTIDINSDSLIWIKFEHDNLTDDRNGWKVQISNSDSVVLCEFDSKWNKPETYSAKVGVPKGSYTIAVSNSTYHSDIQYNISVYAEETLCYEKEQNNQVLSSTDVKFADNSTTSTIYGNLAYSNDVDFYKFEMQDDGHISLKFEHRNLTYDKTSWNIEIWNENSEVLYRFDSKMNKISVITPNIGLKKGTYYIKVYLAYEYSSELYAISLSCKYGNNWENETNGSISNARLIEGNDTYYGTIKNSSDEDYYFLNCVKSGMYSVGFKHELVENNSVRWKIEVLDEQSELILTEPLLSNWNDLEVVDNFNLEEGKVYYIRIYPYGDCSDIDYSFMIKKTS